MCRFLTSQQTLFNFLIFGILDFLPKNVLKHQLQLTEPAQKCENYAIFKQNYTLVELFTDALLFQFRGKPRFRPKKCFKTSTTIEQKTQLFFVRKKIKSRIK